MESISSAQGVLHDEADSACMQKMDMHCTTHAFMTQQSAGSAWCQHESIRRCRGHNCMPCMPATHACGCPANRCLRIDALPVASGRGMYTRLLRRRRTASSSSAACCAGMAVQIRQIEGCTHNSLHRMHTCSRSWACSYPAATCKCISSAY